MFNWPIRATCGHGIHIRFRLTSGDDWLDLTKERFISN